VFLIAEVFLHLDLQAGLEDLLGQIAQQPARADEIDPMSVLAWVCSSDLAPLGVVVLV